MWERVYEDDMVTKIVEVLDTRGKLFEFDKNQTGEFLHEFLYEIMNEVGGEMGLISREVD